MIRAVAATVGGLVGGAIPLAVAESIGASPPGMAAALSIASGAAGALGVLYAFATPRRECKITHHNVNNKIDIAHLRAEAAALVAQKSVVELAEFRGEVTAKLDGLAVSTNRIADHLGVIK